MRIDLPGCSFKNCKYCSDCNCTNQNKYETCDYRVLKDEFVSGQLDLQKEIEKLDGLLVCKNKTITGLTAVINGLNYRLKAAKSDAGFRKQDMKDVRHGEWLLEKEPDGTPYCFHCSVCDPDFSRISVKSATNYCPDCGAEMDGVKCD